MGTRGCIARLTENGFEGRYHHWDSYPDGLGESLWRLYHSYFKEDLEAMLKVLIDEHKAGWSTICHRDFNHKAGFVEHMTTEDIDNKTEAYRRPQCYCHGSRNEEAWLVTEENASDSGIEWVYAFDVAKKTMHILASYNEDGTKMIGMFGLGNPKAEWTTVKIVNLDGKEPNWTRIQENIKEESRKIWEENQCKKREKFLKNVKVAQQNLEKFGTFRGMSMMLYELWYKEDVQPHLSESTKINVAKRISELTLKSAIWIDKKKNYIEEFPELKDYSNTGHISGFQLCVVMSAIVKELQERVMLDKVKPQ